MTASVPPRRDPWLDFQLEELRELVEVAYMALSDFTPDCRTEALQTLLALIGDRLERVSLSGDTVRAARPTQS